MPLPPVFLDALVSRARAAGVFGDVRVERGALICDAKASAEPAFYSVREEGGRVSVLLQTPARYLSQSIEADLMFTGDKIADLVHEEMMDLGYAHAHADAPELAVDHFRSHDKLYTFCSAVPVTLDEVNGEMDRALALVICTLLGYQAAFAELGDMTAEDD